MRVYLGTDHAGFALKQLLVAWLRDHGHEPVDCGALTEDSDDDYPAYCAEAARRAVGDPGSAAVVVGGSGNGEAIAANKVPGARAAVCWSADVARLAREHNDANVCSLGARLVDPGTAYRIVSTFLGTPFSGEERHVRRISQLAALDRR